MPIATSMLPEFDHEMKTTRTLLERVPDAKADWKPHARSMSLGRIAIHIPQMVLWIPVVLHETALDVAGPPTIGLDVSWESTTATLATFDRAVTAGRAALAAVSDDALMVPWTLRAGAHVIMTIPRVAVLRTMVMNHIIHHRGQLSVYLRLNDVPLPDIYGPTADSVR